MTPSQRLWAVVAGAAAALPASLVLPMALGHAIPHLGDTYETCNDAVCLVMGDPHGNWHYGGIRPLFTSWNGEQPYNVIVNGADGPVNAGSYDVTVHDTWNPLLTFSEYHYGAFTPNDAAPAGIDIGQFADMTGAAIRDIHYGDYHLLMMSDIGEHDLGYIAIATQEVTHYLAYDATGTAAFVQYAGEAPMQLWNSLFHSWIPWPPEYLIPADPFSGVDFDPGEFVDWTNPAAFTDWLA